MWGKKSASFRQNQKLAQFFRWYSCVSSVEGAVSAGWVGFGDGVAGVSISAACALGDCVGGEIK